MSQGVIPVESIVNVRVGPFAIFDISRLEIDDADSERVNGISSERDSEY